MRAETPVATMDAPERYEQLIAFLDSNLPSPVDRQESADGSVQFTGGEPAEVVVSLTDTSVLVSEFAGVWESAFTFAARPRRVGVLKWRRLPETALFNALSVLIKGAREARLSRFQTVPLLRAQHRARMDARRRRLPGVRRPAQRRDSLKLEVRSQKLEVGLGRRLATSNF